MYCFEFHQRATLCCIFLLIDIATTSRCLTVEFIRHQVNKHNEESQEYQEQFQLRTFRCIHCIYQLHYRSHQVHGSVLTTLESRKTLLSTLYVPYLHCRPSCIHCNYCKQYARYTLPGVRPSGKHWYRQPNVNDLQTPTPNALKQFGCLKILDASPYERSNNHVKRLCRAISQWWSSEWVGAVRVIASRR